MPRVSKTPNSIEFALMTDPKSPGYLSDAELAALYGAPVSQVRAWKVELRETGLIRGADRTPRGRAETIERIIDGCLGAIHDVATMDMRGATTAEKIRHMDACSNVLARVMPFMPEKQEERTLTPEEAFAAVERATRSADVVMH
jgi:transposase-like protein